MNRVKAKGIKVIGVTIIPRHNVAAVQDNTGWNDAKTGIRNQVNEWIRAKAGFDIVRPRFILSAPTLPVRALTPAGIAQW